MSAAQPGVLETESHEGIAIATVNRPGKSNALSVEVIDALDNLIRRLSSAGGERALVITGSGSRAFSAGADISELVGIGRGQARDRMIRGQQVFAAIEDLPMPVIAAINGAAVGGGLELAMACDVRIAAPTATLGQPEIALANLPGWGGTQRLPRLIGEGRALEMILTGDPIDARRAESIGLVNAVSEDPLAAAVAMARRMIEHSPGALDAAKRAVYFGVRHGIVAGSAMEAELVADRCATDEQRAAVEAFRDRRSTIRKEPA